MAARALRDLSRRPRRAHAPHASDYIVRWTVAAMLLGFAIVIGMKLIDWIFAA
jgi:hypothetical protein